MIERPDPSEHNEYYSTYVRLVPEGDVLESLRAGIGDTDALLRGLPDERARHRYAPGKWSTKEVLGHLADTERTFAFRAFWFARQGPGDLAAFDQDPFAAESRADDRDLDSLLDELQSIRAATVSLFDSFDPTVLTRSGIASGFRFTVRAFPFIIAGHEIHHRAILQDRYGLG